MLGRSTLGKSTSGKACLTAVSKSDKASPIGCVTTSSNVLPASLIGCMTVSSITLPAALTTSSAFLPPALITSSRGRNALVSISTSISGTAFSTKSAIAVPTLPIGRTTSLTTSSITPKSILVSGKSIEPNVPPSLI